ncbi:hypothetical protein HGRIS_014342 [Hohenbuehelia grisea]|uniref:Uncharacterized protein n=1 Tax=Hohenbuehelia grisea TaxID=104357 RepID=A0ABR3JV22_9AGAR
MPLNPGIYSAAARTCSGESASEVPAKADFDPGISSDPGDSAQGSRALGVSLQDIPDGPPFEPDLSQRLAVTLPSLPPVPEQTTNLTNDPKLTRLFCFVDKASVVVTTECGYFACQEPQSPRHAVVFETRYTGLRIKPKIRHYTKPVDPITMLMQKGLPDITVCNLLLRHDPSFSGFFENDVEKLFERGLPTIPDLLLQEDPLLSGFLSTKKPKASQPHSAMIFATRFTGLRVKLKTHYFSNQGMDSLPEASLNTEVPEQSYDDTPVEDPCIPDNDVETGDFDASTEFVGPMESDSSEDIGQPTGPEDSAVVTAVDDTEDTPSPAEIAAQDTSQTSDAVSDPDADDTMVTSDEDFTLCEDSETSMITEAGKDVLGPEQSADTDEDSCVAEPQLGEPAVSVGPLLDLEATPTEADTSEMILDASDVESAATAAGIWDNVAQLDDTKDTFVVAAAKEDPKDAPIQVKIVDSAAEDSIEKLDSLDISVPDDAAVSMELPAPAHRDYCAPSEAKPPVALNEDAPHVDHEGDDQSTTPEVGEDTSDIALPASAHGESCSSSETQPPVALNEDVTLVDHESDDELITSEGGEDKSDVDLPVATHGDYCAPSEAKQVNEHVTHAKGFCKPCGKTHQWLMSGPEGNSLEPWPSMPIKRSSQPDIWRAHPVADDPVLWSVISGKSSIADQPTETVQSSSSSSTASSEMESQEATELNVPPIDEDAPDLQEPLSGLQESYNHHLLALKIALNAVALAMSVHSPPSPLMSEPSVKAKSKRKRPTRRRH